MRHFMQWFWKVEGQSISPHFNVLRLAGKKELGKGQRQDLEVGTLSGPYILVLMIDIWISWHLYAYKIWKVEFCLFCSVKYRGNWAIYQHVNRDSRFGAIEMRKISKFPKWLWLARCILIIYPESHGLSGFDGECLRIWKYTNRGLCYARQEIYLKLF